MFGGCSTPGLLYRVGRRLAICLGRVFWCSAGGFWARGVVVADKGRGRSLAYAATAGFLFPVSLDVRRWDVGCGIVVPYKSRGRCPGSINDAFMLGPGLAAVLCLRVAMTVGGTDSGGGGRLQHVVRRRRPAGGIRQCDRVPNCGSFGFQGA